MSPYSFTSISWTDSRSGHGLTRRAILGRVIAAAAIMALGSACSDERAATAPTPPPVVTPAIARVVLSTAEGTVRIGSTMQLQAFAVSSAGDTLRDRTITWRSDNPTIASVTSVGVVSGIAAGTVAIRAQAGTIESAAMVTVPLPVPAREVGSVELDVAQLEVEEGVTRQLTATVRDTDGAPWGNRTVAWSTADASIATVTASGVVTAVRAGVTAVRASIDGKVGTATVRVTTRSAYDLLFDSRTGYGNESELYALDIRGPDATPTRIGLPVTGTWDVTPSPDGKRIAFVAREPFGPQLFVALRDGTGARLITSESGGADQPAWSPDGSRIAYRAWNAGGPPGPFNPSDIKIVNVDGTGTVSLTANRGTPMSASWPTWSPRGSDGRHRVAYSQQELSGYLRGRIMSVREDGAETRALTAASDYLESEPAWSPDGASILFVRTGGTAAGDLWLLDVARGTSRQLMSSDPADDQHAPAWSPDGELIAFSSKHEPGVSGGYFFQLYTVAANGTGLTRRTPSGGDKSNPAWILRQ